MQLSELLSVHLVKRAGVTLERQLYEALRAAMLRGRLEPGAKLPSTRRLAKELGLSRNTALGAVKRLELEGYVENRRGSGCYVSQALPDELPSPPPLRPGKPSPLRLSSRGRALAELPGTLRAQTLGAFDLGPDFTRFPFDTWARCLGRAWRNPSRSQVLDSEPGGYSPLREWLARYLRATRSLAVVAEQVIIVSGGQQALDLVGRLLLEPGEPVLTEDPGYAGIHGALIAAGSRPVPIPIDVHGFNIELAEARVPEARVAVVTPSHQYPLGITLPLERRLGLLSWAERVDGWVLEDDYDSEFRYEGSPVASLQGLDDRGRVLYLGTFSKAMFPSLRLGYLVVPRPLIDPLLRARRYLDGHASMVTQVACAEFCESGAFTSHLRAMRKLYRERREIVMNGLVREFSSQLLPRAGEGGMHLVAELRDRRRSDAQLVERAKNFGVHTRALSSYYRSGAGSLDTATTPAPRSGLVLGFAAHTPRQLRMATGRLAEAYAAQ